MTRPPPSVRRQLPFVFINAAITADGKIATANRSVHSFGSARDQQHLYELRATADAVMCGARTLEISRATLGNGGEKFRKRRLRNGLAEFPLRVVVSGSASIDPRADIFQTRSAPILLLAARGAPGDSLRRLRGLVQEVKVSGTEEINFVSALRWLGERWGVRRLLCEGGGELNDALFRAGLVDEVHLTFCPKIFGGRLAPTLADGPGGDRLADAVAFKLTSFRRAGGELFTVYSRFRKQ